MVTDSQLQEAIERAERCLPAPYWACDGPIRSDCAAFARELLRVRQLAITQPRRVVIEVSGGMAECTSSPDDVDVIIRDWDNIKAGDEDPEFSREEWERDIQNGVTHLDYVAWIKYKGGQ